MEYIIGVVIGLCIVSIPAGILWLIMHRIDVSDAEKIKRGMLQ